MIVGIDVDEVCADLLSEWVRRYNLRYDDTLNPDLISEWDMSKVVKPECGKDIYRILSEPDLYANVQPIPGAVEAVRDIRGLGARVVFVTSCARHQSDQKREWLIQHGFLPEREFEPDFITASDKALIGVDVLVDDNIATVEKFPRDAMLVTKSYNEHIPTKVQRVPRLAAVPSALVRRYGVHALSETPIPIGTI